MGCFQLNSRARDPGCSQYDQTHGAAVCANGVSVTAHPRHGAAGIRSPRTKPCPSPTSGFWRLPFSSAERGNTAIKLGKITLSYYNDHVSEQSISRLSTATEGDDNHESPSPEPIQAGLQLRCAHREWGACTHRSCIQDYITMMRLNSRLLCPAAVCAQGGALLFGNQGLRATLAMTAGLRKASADDRWTACPVSWRTCSSSNIITRVCRNSAHPHPHPPQSVRLGLCRHGAVPAQPRHPCHDPLPAQPLRLFHHDPVTQPHAWPHQLRAGMVQWPALGAAVHGGRAVGPALVRRRGVARGPGPDERAAVLGHHTPNRTNRWACGSWPGAVGVGLRGSGPVGDGQADAPHSLAIGGGLWTEPQRGQQTCAPPNA